MKGEVVLKNNSAVLDTSIIITGVINKLLMNKKIKNLKSIIIPLCVISEIRNLANDKGKRKADGIKGFKEIENLLNICKDFGIDIKYDGRRPNPDEIKLARDGELDDLIIDVAENTSSTLLTCDRVQYLTAVARKIDSCLYSPKGDLIKKKFFYDYEDRIRNIAKELYGAFVGYENNLPIILMSEQTYKMGYSEGIYNKDGIRFKLTADEHIVEKIPTVLQYLPKPEAIKIAKENNLKFLGYKKGVPIFYNPNVEEKICILGGRGIFIKLTNKKSLENVKI
ncbi:ATPase [Methanocaldococcus villosus KIN24-T80]|uniref:ATPase n=1 Tax=Methanocaldococcus villosus KIN24-T80 TaxID=1069083 RepID=N6UTR9_9EURY|nr:PIN domain-containing protein [Methanocaldococcus villosus]ENN95739.1 ATPase [Methanocaldococcus villosus KIN24-T80]